MRSCTSFVALAVIRTALSAQFGMMIDDAVLKRGPVDCARKPMRTMTSPCSFALTVKGEQAPTHGVRAYDGWPANVRFDVLVHPPSNCSSAVNVGSVVKTLPRGAGGPDSGDDLRRAPVIRGLTRAERPTLRIANIGFGTTATHGLYEGLCKAGVPAVHFHLACNLSPAQRAPHDKLVVLWRILRQCAECSALSKAGCRRPACAQPGSWLSQLREAIRALAVSGIVAALDSPYPYLLRELLTVAPGLLLLQTLRSAKVFGEHRLARAIEKGGAINAVEYACAVNHARNSGSTRTAFDFDLVRCIALGLADAGRRNASVQLGQMIMPLNTANLLRDTLHGTVEQLNDEAAHKIAGLAYTRAFTEQNGALLRFAWESRAVAGVWQICMWDQPRFDATQAAWPSPLGCAGGRGVSRAVQAAALIMRSSDASRYARHARGDVRHADGQADATQANAPGIALLSDHAGDGMPRDILEHLRPPCAVADDMYAHRPNSQLPRRRFPEGTSPSSLSSSASPTTATPAAAARSLGLGTSAAA